eukprot:SAG22_NODE_1345_length_4675_cov_2.245629_2_plen_332_part_00
MTARKQASSGCTLHECPHPNADIATAAAPPPLAAPCLPAPRHPTFTIAVCDAACRNTLFAPVDNAALLAGEIPTCKHKVGCDVNPDNLQSVGTEHVDGSTVMATIAWNMNAVPPLIKACRQAQARLSGAVPNATAAEKEAAARLISSAYTWPTFQSLALSMGLPDLAKVTAHATNAYYNSPVEYIEKTFPTVQRADGSPFPPTDTVEQDGLIARTYGRDKRRSLFPICPRCVLSSTCARFDSAWSSLSIAHASLLLPRGSCILCSFDEVSSILLVRLLHGAVPTMPGLSVTITTTGTGRPQMRGPRTAAVLGCKRAGRLCSGIWPTSRHCR